MSRISDELYPDMPLGKGTIRQTRDGLEYSIESFPDPEGLATEEIYIIRKSDMDKIIRDSCQILMSNHLEMTPQMWHGKECFPDEITLNNPRTQDKKSYFLDRTLYSLDFKNWFMVRYETVEQALKEESDLIPEVD